MIEKKLIKRTKLKILVLVPIAAILLFGITNVNGQNTTNDKTVTAVAPTKMNVLYVGVDNPVKIAVSGYESSDIEVSITNGVILGENGDYIIRARKPGNMILVVKACGTVVERTELRVKSLPNPVAMVNRKKGGVIDKEILLEQNKIAAVMENFDFDLDFRIIEFTISITKDNYFQDIISNSNKITDKQKELIKSAALGSKVIFEKIIAIGPDGSKRNLSPIIFELK